MKTRNKISMYPFRLEFDKPDGAARFPFVFEGDPLDASFPSCALSARSAGDMKFNGRVSGEAGVHGPARERFFRSMGIDPERVYSLVQIHSRDVYAIGDPPDSAGSPSSPAGFARPGDGMVSFCRSVFLAVTVADCLPVFLLDTENRFFAALHSGWKGTGIVRGALDIMEKAGTRPGAVAAVLGPCIRVCCYRVDERRANDFENEFGEGPLGSAVLHKDDGPYINLQAANARLLADAGVRHIAVCEDCTYTDERLGSYRREGPSAYTRMAAMAGPFGIVNQRC